MACVAQHVSPSAKTSSKSAENHSLLWSGHARVCAKILRVWMSEHLTEAVRVQQVGALILASHDKNLRGTQDLAPALFDIVANGKNGIDVDRQAADVKFPLLRRVPVSVTSSLKALRQSRIGPRGIAATSVLPILRSVMKTVTVSDAK